MKTHVILAALATALICAHSFAADPRDNTLEIVRMETPAFPLRLLERGITSGETQAVVSISPDGKIADWLVTAYTDPAFERMTGEILRTLVCKLPASDSHAGPVRATLGFSFETKGAVISQTINDTVSCLITRVTGTPRIEKLGTTRDLDRALSVRYSISPLHPANTDRQSGGRVTLDFLIDETGRVRMPVLHQGDNWQFAEAAADALLNWQFDPPTRRGQPMIVAARQEFVFAPEP